MFVDYCFPLFRHRRQCQAEATPSAARPVRRPPREDRAIETGTVPSATADHEGNLLGIAIAVEGVDNL